MANSKEIKIQIASIGNTQKITSAMEKVAVSKMKKTQDKMLKGRPYRDRMLSVISHLAKDSLNTNQNIWKKGMLKILP